MSPISPVYERLLLRPTKFPYIQFLRDVQCTLAIRGTWEPGTSVRVPISVPIDCEPCRCRGVERALEGIYDEATNVWEELKERVSEEMKWVRCRMRNY